MAITSPAVPSYHDLLGSIKQEVHSAQIKAALSVNSALIQLYWNMGKMIADNQALFEGRNNFVAQLAADLQDAFPEMKGFSRSNLFYIRRFYQFYAPNPSVQQAVGLKDFNPSDSVQQAVGLNQLVAIPWGHHVVLINKAKDVEEALFYIQQVLENNWSRSALLFQIEADLYAR